MRARRLRGCVRSPMLEKKRESDSGLAEATPHYIGHRERLRQRFREAGSDALSDYELLELLMFRVLPQRDVKPLAKSLLEKFGSFALRSSPRRKCGLPRSRVSAKPASPTSRFSRPPRTGCWAVRSGSDRCCCHGRSCSTIAGQRRLSPIAKSSACCFSTSAISSSPTKRSRSAPSITRRSIRASGQARARTIGHRDHPRAQSSLRRSDAVARRHPDDATDYFGGVAARHFGA
jgi:hypothetical protein